MICCQANPVHIWFSLASVETTTQKVVESVLTNDTRGFASAQSNADCSAAVRRVLAQTQGELLSVSVGKSGGQAVCKITVLANDSSGKRRRKLTVNARP